MNEKAKTGLKKSNTREDIRAKMIDATPKAETTLVDIFGVTLELRQPPLGLILDAEDIPDSKARTAQMIIRYCCVPNTDGVLAFEDSDVAAILKWPYSPDFTILQDALLKLSGIEIELTEEELKNSPLEEQP